MGFKGLYYLVYEVVDNVIDEVLVGYCIYIEIDINVDGFVIVVDNGWGIFIDIYFIIGRLVLEIVLMVFYVGGKFGGGGYKVFGGLYGVGVFVVNVLFEWVEVKVWCQGKEYFQWFEWGNFIGMLEVILNEGYFIGIQVFFLLDIQIFKDGIEFDYYILVSCFKELVYFNVGVCIIFGDCWVDFFKEEQFYYEGGIREYVIYMIMDKILFYEEIIYIFGEKNDVQVEVVFQWCVDVYSDIFLGFVNNICIIDGGIYLEGLKVVLICIFNFVVCKCNKLKDGDSNLGGENICEGLIGVIFVKVLDLEFEG